MKEHELENKSTKGSILLEVANELGLKGFNMYLRTDKLTSKQGILNLTDNYKKALILYVIIITNILIAFVKNHLKLFLIN